MPCLLVQVALAAVGILSLLSPADTSCLLFPFGSGVGHDGHTNYDDRNFKVDLSVPYVFYGTQYSSLYISSNGVISFGQALPEDFFTPTESAKDYPYLAPFWSDIVIMNGGQLHIGVSNASQYTTLAAQDAQMLGNDFVPTEVLVVTWENVQTPKRGGEPTHTNTFQAVLATNGQQSYATFSYEKIEWVETWTWDDRFAVVGLNSGAPLNTSLFLDNSGTADIKDIVITSNVGMLGKLVFRTDDTSITTPNVTVGCTCDIALNTTVPSTFSGEEGQKLFKKGKTKISGWDLIGRDSCKFLLVISSRKGAVNWLAFGFGVFRNPKKMVGNVVFNRIENAVELRGPITSEIKILTLPWSWTDKSESTHVCITGSGQEGWTLESNTCPWSLHYKPGGDDAGVQLVVGDYFREKTLLGRCLSCTPQG